MRIAYITAGAAGMFCGSCLHDNTLAAALLAQGHDAVLIPTYTPTRTDEVNVSQKRVFFGGINVFLQQKLGVFRRTPWFLDRLLDAPGLLRWVSRFALKTEAQQLAELTISMLQGEHGRQRKEVEKLVHWLKTDLKPEIIVITAVLLSGMVSELKRQLGVPILGMLQGDDIFLESLPEPSRTQALELVRRNCRQFDGFLTTSKYYRDFNAQYLAIPAERIDVVYPGLNLKGHGGQMGRDGRPFTIGYFARVCPEKGLHVLAEAFSLLRQQPGVPPCRLRVSGWLGENNRRYFDDIRNTLEAKGLANDFEYMECPDHASKVRFLQSLDVLSVPTTYREPKGLYVLEAWANGVPVVQPRHGSFPELIEMTQAGYLVEPENPADLARTLERLVKQPKELREMGAKGKAAVEQFFTAERMARETVEMFRKYLS